MELRSRIYRDIQENLKPNWREESLEGQVLLKRLNEEQGKTKTKLSHLSDLKFRVLLFDVFEQVEQRFPFTSLATKRSIRGLDKSTLVEEIALSGDESSQISSGPRQGMSQDLLSALVLLSRYSKRISAVGLRKHLNGRLKPPSSLLDQIEESELEIEPTLNNPSTEKMEKSTDQVVNGVTDGDGDDTDINLLESPTEEIYCEKVLEIVENCKNSLDNLFKCYQPPICLDQGLAIKPMKTAISSLQDLSTNLSKFMIFLKKSDQDNERDNIFRFLNCLLELIGSCVGVIMSKFHPSRTQSDEIQVIQYEIFKIRYLLQSLETALSFYQEQSRGTLSLSHNFDTVMIELNRKCPWITGKKSINQVLDFHRDFQNFLFCEFMKSLIEILISPSVPSQTKSVQKMIQFLKVRVSLLLEIQSVLSRNNPGIRCFIEVINEAVQSLSATCKSLPNGGDHDVVVKIVEGLFELERGVHGVGAGIEMQITRST